MAPAAPLPPGSYMVKPGDTLIRIGLDSGQNWRDIARWNGIQNPNLIEVGQVLRVLPPVQDTSAAVSRPVQAAGRLESRPLEARAAEAAPAVVTPSTPADRTAAAATSGSPVTAPASAAPSSVPGSANAQAAPSAPPTTAAASRAGDEAVEWAWPAAGTVNSPFDEARGVKGLSIAGKAGDPVLAAADGRVVYAGSGLRGYGNLVIVKHNNTYLTAYAHNQTLLVKEDQAVRRGQKIAEMGSSDADQVKLHFEIRRLGKPVDPARLLPTR
ncbi:MAG: peptidoglycan DD-metalloendopeptidase family protein [Betaproteobacteria bacterium]